MNIELINKQAILIMAHNNLDLLKKLIVLLDSEYFDIFIHVDKKNKEFIENDFLSIANKSKVYFIERKKIYWGHFSQIDCELRLYKKAYEFNYSMYHLISGVDLPIKSAKKIYEFFEKNNQYEFIHFDNLEMDDKFLERVEKYHFLIKSRNNKLCMFISKFFLKTQIFIKRSRRICFQKGANWCSLSHLFVGYLLQNEKKIKKMFKFSLCGDEMFVQTMIINSDYSSRIYNFSNQINSNFRLIDWDRGNPYIFTVNDSNLIYESDAFFARKFDECVDKEIIEQVFYKVMELTIKESSKK